MKLNSLQKILILIYIFLILFYCVLNVPFGDGDDYVEYSTIWSHNSGLEISRILFYLLIFTVVFCLCFLYLDRMNDIDPKKYREKAKTELNVFKFLFGSTLVLFSFFIINNLVNTTFKTIYNYEINALQDSIDNKPLTILIKEQRRRILWNLCLKAYNLDKYKNNIENF